MSRRRDKPLERGIARLRIVTLFGQADRAARSGRRDRAERYVALARRLGERYLVRVPSEFNRRHCKACGAYWLPNDVRIRLRHGRLVATCHGCGALRRFGLAPKRGAP